MVLGQVVLQDAAPGEQLLDVGIFACPQSLQFVLYMKSRHVQAFLGTRPSGTEAVVELVEFLTGKASRNIGRGRLVVSDLSALCFILEFGVN